MALVCTHVNKDFSLYNFLFLLSFPQNKARTDDLQSGHKSSCYIHYKNIYQLRTCWQILSNILKRCMKWRAFSVSFFFFNVLKWSAFMCVCVCVCVCMVHTWLFRKCVSHMLTNCQKIILMPSLGQYLQFWLWSKILFSWINGLHWLT